MTLWLIIRLVILFFSGVFAGVLGLCIIQDDKIRWLALSRQLLIDIFHWNNANQLLPEILKKRIERLLKEK